MSHAPLLIELLCEELPPKALARLSDALGAHLRSALESAGFVPSGSTAHVAFATPRRLAVLFSEVRARQEDREVMRKGPAVQAGLDANGNPTAALSGFARSCGVGIEQLERVREGKAEHFAFRSTRPGEVCLERLAGTGRAEGEVLGLAFAYSL